MKRILQYFSICILFNIFMNCIFFSLIYTQNYNNHIVSSLEYLSIVNIAKIIIQFEITRRIRKRLSFVKLSYTDLILDFAKLSYYTYMTIEFDKFFINNKMYAVFAIIILNYLVIFMQFIANMISPNLYVDVPQPQQLFITRQAETYISFDNYINVHTVSETNNIICPICLDEKKIAEEWTKLLCEHEFHYKCITEWLNKNRSCPICRIVI